MNKTIIEEVEYAEPTEEQKKRTFFWSILVDRKQKHSYQGTVPAHVKAKRRARGKVAKASRKVNRGK